MLKIVIRHLRLAAILLLVLAPPMPASEPPPLPKRFHAYIGGFMGASYRVELKDGTLTYTSFGKGFRNSKPVAIKPTDAQWLEFRKTLDELKVWQWKSSYVNRGVCDGTQWSLDIAYADHELKTGGSNSYPGTAGKPVSGTDPDKVFRRYLDAIGKLAGGKPFQ